MIFEKQDLTTHNPLKLNTVISRTQLQWTHIPDISAKKSILEDACFPETPPDPPSLRPQPPFTQLTRSTFQDSDDEISHLEWETVRVRFVKAGTLKKLVEALSTDDGELETTYINVFLATYRSFSTPREVLKLLLQRYEELSDLPVNGEADQHEQHKK